MKFVAVIALVGLFSSYTFADEVSAQVAATTVDTSCASGSEADQINCLTSAYGATEQSLANAYKGRLQSLKDREQFEPIQAVFYENMIYLVQASQRVWIIDRDSQCNLEVQMAQKAAYSVPTTMRCKMRIARERISFLNNFTISVRK